MDNEVVVHRAILFVDPKAERLTRLHFPWREVKLAPPMAGQPLLPSHEAAVRAWVEQRIRPFRPVVIALVARLVAVLAGLKTSLPEHRRPRFLYRLDTSHILKSPESVLERIAREWKEEDSPPPIDFENFHREMQDLGRIRIVANFLSDALAVQKALEEPFRTSEPVTTAGTELRAEFRLVRNRFDDKIHLDPRDREKGERSIQGVFHPACAEGCLQKVEVQIITQLQEAWDKKDHFLIYEPRRRGEPISAEHEREMFALSELLYLADLGFDRLREEVERGRRESRHP